MKKKRELIIHASEEMEKGNEIGAPEKNPINYTGSAHAHATQAQNDSMLTPYIKLLIHLMNSHSFASALAALKWSTHIVIHRIVSVCVLSAPTIKKNNNPYNVRQMCCFNLKRIVKCAKCVMKTIRIHNLRLCTSNVLLLRQSYPVGYYAEAIAKPVREKPESIDGMQQTKVPTDAGRSGGEGGRANEWRENKQKSK